MLPQAPCDHLITHQDHRPALGEDRRGSAARGSAASSSGAGSSAGNAAKTNAAKGNAGASSAANAPKGSCCKHQDKTRNGGSNPGYFWWVVLVCYVLAAGAPCLLHACCSFFTCRVLLCTCRVLHAGSCFALRSSPHLLCACCFPPSLVPAPSLVCLLHPCSSPLASCLSTAVVGRGLPCCHTVAAAMSRHSRHGTHYDRQQRCDTLSHGWCHNTLSHGWCHNTLSHGMTSSTLGQVFTRS